jgi:predicted DNA-binding ribbon-helix-helix protein
MHKRSVVIKGHSTSVRLELEFWTAIDLICVNEKLSFAQMLNLIEQKKSNISNLASFLRVLCLLYFSNKSSCDFENLLDSIIQGSQ